MNFQKRKDLYSKLEVELKRPIIAYVNNIQPFVLSYMSSDVIPQFAKKINEIPKSENEINILIISYGGDPMVSWRIISMLRERFSKIGVIIPYVAYSAATLLALGADEIYMHPFANLGPVDPQIIDTKKQNRFSPEDIRYFFQFVQKDIGLTDQSVLAKSLKLVCQDLGAHQLGYAKRSAGLAVSMSEKLLNLHMDEKNKAKAIAESLNSSFYDHGYPVGRKEAAEIGLKIMEPNEIVESLLWQVYESFSDELMWDKPRHPLEILLNNKEAFKELIEQNEKEIPNPLKQLKKKNSTKPLKSQSNMMIENPEIEMENENDFPLHSLPMLASMPQKRTIPVSYELLLTALETARNRSIFINKGYLIGFKDIKGIGTDEIDISHEWKIEN